MSKRSFHLSRRRFLRSSVATIGALTVLPAGLARGYAANEKVNVGLIGVGGVARGNHNALKAAGANVVALCDVDAGSLKRAAKKDPQAKHWRDFRKMLQQQANLDAVMVSTPDHTHAPASLMAIRLGKHVSTEKPLTHNVGEARLLAEAAKAAKVTTQLDNEGHSSDDVRTTVEWVRGGVIGEVREVHIWTNRPIWPQAIAERPPQKPVPEDLDWDLWLGPAAYREYHAGLHPFKWRGWWDFGTGALGDMGCHYFDATFWALELGHPHTVSAEQEGNTAETGPKWSIVRYEFPARGDMPPVKLTWYDGGKLPPKPAELGADEELPNNGVLLVGSKGTLMTVGRSRPRVLGQRAGEDFEVPEPWLPRPGGHNRDWLQSIREGKRSSGDFQEFGGPLTECVLLGNVPIRSGKPLEWDGPAMKIRNHPEAEQYLTREYRKGWGPEDLG